MEKTMTKEKPRPLPVFIESFTGFNLRLDFVRMLTETIIEAVCGEHNLTLDWIKLEADSENITVIICQGETAIKDALHGYRIESSDANCLMLYFVDGLARQLARLLQGNHANSEPIYFCREGGKPWTN